MVILIKKYKNLHSVKFYSIMYLSLYFERMEQLMYYIIDPQSQDPKDVIIDYAINRFFVGGTDKDAGGYVVERSTLVDEKYKYTCEIISGILSGILNDADEDLSVCITDRASEAITLICEANRELF